MLHNVLFSTNAIYSIILSFSVRCSLNAHLGRVKFTLVRVFVELRFKQIPFRCVVELTMYLHMSNTTHMEIY
jgi:hypothetical protein